MRLDLFEHLSKKELLLPVKSYIIPVETSFNKNLSVSEMLSLLQGKKISHEISYFYSVDDRNRLCGIIGTRNLLFSDPETFLKDISDQEVIQVNEESSLKTALYLMVKHHLLAIPVTNKDGQLCGILEFPKAHLPIEKSVVSEKGRERDIFQLVGLFIDQKMMASSLKEFRYRMPWLLCNLIAGLICAGISSFFYKLLDDVVVIAMFIPLVLTLGESVSMQSMTLSLQFLNYGKIPWRLIKERVIVESKTAILLGSACAFLVAIIYLVSYSDSWPIVAISISIFLTMAAATMFGSLLPIILHIMKLDPKVASGPVVLMLADVSTTIIYFGFSNWLLLK